MISESKQDVGLEISMNSSMKGFSENSDNNVAQEITVEETVIQPAPVTSPRKDFFGEPIIR